MTWLLAIRIFGVLCAVNVVRTGWPNPKWVGLGMFLMGWFMRVLIERGGA